MKRWGGRWDERRKKKKRRWQPAATQVSDKVKREVSGAEAKATNRECSGTNREDRGRQAAWPNFT